MSDHASDVSRHARARLCLSTLVEPGDPRLPLLIGEHGVEGVLAAAREDRPLEGRALPRAWTDRAAAAQAAADAALERARAVRLRWIVPGDREWPGRLDDLDRATPHAGSTGAPLGLWVRGEVDLAPLLERTVSIVGARSHTEYGRQCAAEIAADVADQGHTVVSGAAFGIDVAAHRGALAVGGPTVAVLACGADVDYPRTHAGLLSRVAETGAVVSEQLPGQTPMRSRFLSRNRIIAALGCGTLVVEAARRSGSLNTLHWADALGRVTMALPGPVTSAQSLGTHQAVRDGLAQLITGGRDVLLALGAVADAEESAGPTGPPPDPALALVGRVLDALSFERPVTTGEVAAHARGAPADVESVLGRLAAHGWCSRAGDLWVLRRLPTA